MILSTWMISMLLSRATTKTNLKLSERRSSQVALGVQFPDALPNGVMFSRGVPRTPSS